MWQATSTWQTQGNQGGTDLRHDMLWLPIKREAAVHLTRKIRTDLSNIGSALSWMWCEWSMASGTFRIIMILGLSFDELQRLPIIIFHLTRLLFPLLRRQTYWWRKPALTLYYPFRAVESLQLIDALWKGVLDRLQLVSKQANQYSKSPKSKGTLFYHEPTIASPFLAAV